MTDHEAKDQLFKECPRKILGFLHAEGKCVHCTSSRFPGKVLCFSQGSELPADAVLTPAQAHFMKQAKPSQGATG